MLFTADELTRILLALAIGACIGWEREYHGKSAGLRTMILISIGSALFTIFSEKLGAEARTLDRIASNIVTGIGFLGAGIIFKEENRVTGLTTASAIWITAALGMGAGGGYYLVSIIATVIVLMVLLLLVPLQRAIDRANQTRVYRIVCNYDSETLKRYEELFRMHRMRFFRGTQSRTEDRITGNWTVEGPVKKHDQIIQALLSDPTITEFDF
ncbi:MAG TPA: MgtC/SapB family protein [Chitinophagaceae bacterium]